MSECQHCYGYGLWAIGAPSPMGPIDASDGYPTKPCKSCGADANPGGDMDDEEGPTFVRDLKFRDDLWE